MTMHLSKPDQSGKDEFINICIIYRFISIVICTFVYLVLPPSDTLLGDRLAIAIGVMAACVIATYLYKNNLSDNMNFGVIVTMCLEVVAYGLFIFLSGGFDSPYLWYFISSLTIIMAAERFEIMILYSMLWCLLCALMGKLYWYPGEIISQANINLGLGFLVIAGSFYTLIVYVRKLDENRKMLNQLNVALARETELKEQVLNHTMDLYGTFNLFAITEPAKIMQELTDLLHRTIAPDGCLLLKVNLSQDIEQVGCSGLSEDVESLLLGRVAKLSLLGRSEASTVPIEVLGTSYTVTYIKNLSNLLGVLIMPQGPKSPKESPQENRQPGENEEVQEQFYLNLIKIILKELDLQEMVEEYIVTEEQNRIANEIHDTVIQKLFAMACSLRLLDEQQPQISKKETSEQLQYIGKAAESTMRELREAIYGLRWDAEGTDSFITKLKLYMEEIERLSGVHINLDVDSGTQRMNINQKNTFYRVICEAVNNAVRHGRATEVEVQVKLSDDDLAAEICDNGKGFTYPPLPKVGQGLRNMHRLVSLLKGQLLIESQPGNGTAIKLILPIVK